MSAVAAEQAWSEIATTSRLDAAALRARDAARDLAIGLASGSLVLLARAMRANGTLGPAVVVARAEAGGLLAVPASPASVVLELRGDASLEAIALDLGSDRPAPRAFERLVLGHFETPQQASAWLEAQGSGEATWRVLLAALLTHAREQALDRIAEEDRTFIERVESLESLDDALLLQSVQQAARSARLAPGAEAALGGDAMLRALRLVVERLGASVPPDLAANPRSSLSPFEQFCRMLHLQHRQVLLADRWWRSEGVPMLAMRTSDQAPVALLPSGSHYRAVVAGSDGDEDVERVDEAFAASLEPHAEMLYRGLPLRALSLRDLLPPIGRGNLGDAAIVALATMAVSSLTALVPVMTGRVIGEVIPLANLNMLVFVGIVLASIAIGRGLLGVVSSIAFVRIQTRAGLSLTAGFVDRLLQLPASFFRDRSSGDLTQRVMAIEQVRASLTQSVLSALLAFFAGFSNLAVLFLYAPSIALPVVGLVALQIALVVSISILLAMNDYRLATAKGRLDGFGMDMLSGIRQIRIQGSTSRVLAQLIARLAPVGAASYRTGLAGLANSSVLLAFSTLVPALVFVRYVASLDLSGQGAMDEGSFVAFITAVTAFLGATAMLGPAIIAAASIVPQYHRLKPLLEALPEVVEGQGESATLAGKVEVRDVVFRYAPEGPAILDGVSIRAEPGEFVAIVGRTGCGKSTLMRILLGLEPPESGAVLYDDLPLESLDPTLVRSQIGVVMQSSEVVTGNVMSTILGVGSRRSIDDAWAAARLVGMDQEIEAMPMGMLTMITPNSHSQSQVQRLLIARALVARPEILLLDEATSSLDNQSQASITATIEALGATRIVIAHRLSTIRGADRIYVLKQGKVVQQGSFEELAADASGHFCELMAGQLS